MSFLIFFLALSCLVIIHEFGHYLAARLFGIKAEEFGFGFPPRLVGFVKHHGRWKLVGPRDRTTYENTIWSFNVLPLGGFVRIKGEQADGVTDPDSIHAKPIWQRAVVLAAGVMMNWVLAVFLFTVVFSFGSVTFLDHLPSGALVSDRRVMVMEHLPDSPAARVGIQEGDTLIAINGKSVQSARAATEAIRSHGLAPLQIEINRNGILKTFFVTPVILSQLKRSGIGVALEDVGKVALPIPQAFLNGVKVAAMLTQATVVAFGRVVTDVFVGKVTSDVSGPVGIAVMAHRIAQQGITPFLQFAAMLSVNLAVINFLPIPALDGGRVLFLVIEKLRRRPMNRTLEIGIHNLAFILLILIILLVTARDLTRYGGVIIGGVRGAIGL